MDEIVGAGVAAPLAPFENGAGAGGNGIALAAEAEWAVDDFETGGFEPRALKGNFAGTLRREVAENGLFAPDEGLVGGVGHVGLVGIGLEEAYAPAGGKVGGYDIVVFSIKQFRVGLNAGVHVGINLVSNPEVIGATH